MRRFDAARHPADEKTGFGPSFFV
ncbi:hypothetical protein BCEP4_630031 [Burkholderia cepacia]|nr:hypothetical protein BCEP4_630031 [Burkholderia cepacia]